MLYPKWPVTAHKKHILRLIIYNMTVMKYLGSIDELWDSGRCVTPEAGRAGNSNRFLTRFGAAAPDTRLVRARNLSQKMVRSKQPSS